MNKDTLKVIVHAITFLENILKIVELICSVLRILFDN